MDNKDSEIIGNRLKELRTKEGLTVRDLAILLDVNPSTLSQYENGKRVPNFALIKKASIYFKVPADHILKFDEDEKYRKAIYNYNKMAIDADNGVSYISSQKSKAVVYNFQKDLIEDEYLKAVIKQNGEEGFKKIRSELLIKAITATLTEMDKFLKYDKFI